MGIQAGPGGQVSAEGGWASRCCREQRWIPAQDRGGGEVVIRGCPGQVVAVAYWAVYVGGRKKGTDLGPPGSLSQLGAFGRPQVRRRSWC